MEPVTYRTKLAGRDLVLEIGKFAMQTSGSVMVRYGETAVLVTAVISNEEKETNFFPLTVNYEERLYAVGKIPGGFIKREGRPSEKAILASRLLDRPVRPLFSEHFRHEVQVVATVMSVDQDCSSEMAAMIGVSVALSLSGVPFKGPLAGVTIGKVDNRLILNPTAKELEMSNLHLVVAGTAAGINMVEAGAAEVPESEILEAILFGYETILELIAFQEKIMSELAIPKKQYKVYEPDTSLEGSIIDLLGADLDAAIYVVDKKGRDEHINKLRERICEHFAEDQLALVKETFSLLVERHVRKMILDEGRRPDGRHPNEIRKLTSETGVLPRTHGSGLFKRGQTQVLSVCTLGALGDVQILDGLGLEESKHFIHHYNFPPYSVGEARPMRAPGRREIGHGALGERALEPVIPSQEKFPYTIRLVSEVLESNGSSSQASICAGTLALMDAGVPIKTPIAGIAMGLIKDGDKVSVLTDIQGMEDYLGDMDFKVAGSRSGITALQMDIKIAGIDKAILEKALLQAHEGRMNLLDNMEECINQPRGVVSQHAPKIISMVIDPDNIRTVVGPGGREINKIINATGVKIDIEQDGRIYISSPDDEQNAKARKIIEDLVRKVAVDDMYMATVTRVEKYGAFVELFRGKEALVHISQLDHKRIEKVEDVVNLGDSVMVKVIEIDDQGRIKVSRKAALDDKQEQK